MSVAGYPVRPAPRSLADVRDPDGDAGYPVHLVDGCRTALVLFAARWHGRQDAVHLHDAGLAATCVDLDKARLTEMLDVYPEPWEFVVDDAYEYAGHAVGVEAWDVVSLDPFTEEFERCASLMDLWCSLARHVVILGTSPSTEVAMPRGWELAGRYHRSHYGGGVQWLGAVRA